MSDEYDSNEYLDDENGELASYNEEYENYLNTDHFVYTSFDNG